MITIITSTFNRKKLLKKTIQSVLEQSEKDFELIIIDDCSTDGTPQMVKRYLKDKRIRYLKTDKNCGSDSQPKNIAIREAKGEYICFLDDDDIYRKDALKVLSKYIKETGVDAVYGDYLISEKGKLKPGWSLDFNGALLQKMNYISMSVAMVKKSCLIEVGGFDETVPKFKDWNLWLRLHKRGYHFLHIPIIITQVYPQKDSISEKFKVEYDKDGKYLPTFFDPVDMPVYANKTIVGENRAIKVAIFTMTMDRLDYTKRMYKAMANLAGYPFDWFVVDQASNDGTVEWLEGKTKASILNKENVGIAKGWNDAVALIKKTDTYDIIIKNDNDAEMMTENWLLEMVELFKRNRTIILSPYVEGLEDSPGGVMRNRQDGQSPYVIINDKVLGISPFLGGIVWASPIEVYNNFLFPDETFYMGNKDRMISEYAKTIGYTLFYCEELRVSHIDGTKGQHLKYPDYFFEQEKQMTEKFKQSKL